MQVTFLGTGSAMPTGQRMQSGILVESGENRILVDCGSGVLHQLQRYGPGYEAVSTVLLTHHHLDHLSDFMALCKARWLAGHDQLTVVGIEGTRQLINDLFDVHEYLQDRLDLTIREIGPGSHRVGGMAITARETDHSMPCLAYRFGDLFGFSGDSAASRELIEFFDGVAVVAHDCSFPSGTDVSNHPTPETLAAAIESASADIGRLYLTHLYPHTQGHHDEMCATIADRTDIETRVAADGLSVRIDHQGRVD